MFDRLNFADKLAELMLLNGYDVKRLAKELHVSKSTVYNLRNSRYKQPDTNIFFDLIELFRCSADYMLGFIEFPPDEVVYHAPLRVYGARLKNLLKAKGETQQAFIENMKISSHLAYKWLSDKTLPSIEYLIQLAEYFEISVDTLIERIK